MTVMAGIPCFNEENHIAQIVRDCLKHVDLVVVVDDGSIDNTAGAAASAGAQVIRHQTNLGKGVAIRTLLEQARLAEVLALVILDGDGQHLPQEIPCVLKPVLADVVDVTIGSRFSNSENRIPSYRAIGLHVLTLVTNIGSGVWLSDSQNGFRAFSARAIVCLDLQERGFAVESEMQFVIGEAGLRVTEVSIHVQYYDGAKRNPLIHGFGNLLSVISIIRMRRPLLFFTELGGGVFTLAITAAALLVKDASLLLGDIPFLAAMWVGALRARYPRLDKGT